MISDCGMSLHTENLTSADFRYVSQSQLPGRFPWGTLVKVFFQIDLSKTYRFKITAISTKGGPNVKNEWMKQYRLRFFVGAKSVPYTESGIEKVGYSYRHLEPVIQTEFSPCLTYRVLSYFHFAQCFYPNTIFLEQLEQSIQRRLESTYFLKLTP